MEWQWQVCSSKGEKGLAGQRPSGWGVEVEEGLPIRPDVWEAE